MGKWSMGHIWNKKGVQSQITKNVMYNPVNKGRNSTIIIGLVA